DLPKISKLLDFLENQDMPIEYEVSFVDKKATYINAIGHPIESIKYVHNFLKEVHSTNDYFTIVNLGSLYNNLAIVHIGLNNLKEGNEYYQKAKSLWSSINHKRPLPIIHNNLGDLALKQGYTNVAKKHFEKAYNMSILLQQPRSKILAALNFGEMYNKMGEFNKAEKYLIEAEELSHDINNFMFMSSINDNMAILYLKAKTFGEYYELIEKIAPEITQNVISKITPLTKTFFFYLLATGQLERISDILKNNNINFFNNHNEEFYYQIKWLIDSEKNETKIRENFSQSIKFAKKDNSQFALCILHIKLAQSYIYDDDYANSNIHYEKSIKIARTYNYQFWLMQLNILKVKIDLVEGNVSKRLLLRKLLAYLEEMKSQSYYQLELRVFEIIIQIYENLSLSNLSKHYFVKYKKLLKKMSKGLPKDDKSSFLLTRKYYTKKLNLFNTLKIEKNKKIWDSEQVSFLYKLLTIDSPDRIQFHIEKIIHMIFPAHKYAIVLFNKKSRDYRNICKTCDFFSNNADIHTNSIEKSFETDKAIRRKLNSKHLLYIPLGSAFLKIGCLIISDDGEFDIQKYEIRRLDLLRLPLTTLLVRIKDLEEIRNKERMIQQLIDLSNNLSHIIDISYLENEILKAAITFTKAMRGIFIRKNIYENHIYTSMLNNEGEDIVNPKNINKTLFMIAEETKVPQYTVSVNHNGITAYAFSIIIEKEFYGTVYLDVANLDSKELLIDDNYMNMFIDSATFLLTQTSFHNKINDRVNEVAHFSDLKSKFVSIVSHELNTPLTSLQKDITELKNSCSDENSSIIKLERKISSLSTKVKDLSTYQRYLISDRGELKFENIDITKLLEKQLQKIKDRLS
ncbi:MAG: hypothetical protein U9N34_08685, partial [Candidatus Cloacimonadota bacterium]|nr:hypothetical protein [Candidatus Cloacimonadota bacterium]